MFGPNGQQLTPVGNGTYKDAQGNLYAWGTNNSVQPTGIKITSDGAMTSTSIISTDDKTIDKSVLGDLKAAAKGALGGLTAGQIGAVFGGVSGAVKNALVNKTNGIITWAQNPGLLTTPGEITFTNGNGTSVTLDKFIVQGVLNNSNGKEALAGIVAGTQTPPSSGGKP